MSPPWTFQLQPDLAAIRPAAHDFRRWAAPHAPDAIIAECELALVEACNNLIDHNTIQNPISLRADATSTDLILTIRDTTPGFAWPANPRLPDPHYEHGRSLYLIHALMTQVEYTRHKAGNELRLRRALKAAAIHSSQSASAPASPGRSPHA